MASSDERKRSRYSGVRYAVAGYPTRQRSYGNLLSDIVLQVPSFVAENERTDIRQRQAEGIAAAKAKGVKFGRPPKPLPHNFHEVHRAWRAKKMILKQAAEACNMPVGTFYDKARKFENIA